jgi:hypothetical protein
MSLLEQRMTLLRCGKLPAKLGTQARKELPERRLVDQPQLERSTQARQFPAALVLRDLGEPSMPEERRNPLLRQSGALASDPQIVRTGHRPTTMLVAYSVVKLMPS